MSLRRALALLCFLLLAVTACGAEPDVPLSAEAEQGRELARASGCAACHGNNGQGVTAPTWQGLYLNKVEIGSDGLEVRASSDYLFESITDPQAKVRANWTLKMPKNDLSDVEVESIIAYIKELQ